MLPAVSSLLCFAVVSRAEAPVGINNNNDIDNNNNKTCSSSLQRVLPLGFTFIMRSRQASEQLVLSADRQNFIRQLNVNKFKPFSLSRESNYSFQVLKLKGSQQNLGLGCKNWTENWMAMKTFLSLREQKSSLKGASKYFPFSIPTTRRENFHSHRSRTFVKVLYCLSDIQPSLYEPLRTYSCFYEERIIHV